MAEWNSVVTVDAFQENREDRFACFPGVTCSLHASFICLRLFAPYLAARQSTFALPIDAGVSRSSDVLNTPFT